MNKNDTTITVCILAYNEQTHIANTIKHIIEGNKDIEYNLKVYANGCTDDTVKIVKELENVYSNLELRDIKIASKPNAWNTAFKENTSNILMFSDADVVLESGSIKVLHNHLNDNDNIVATTCQYTPHKEGLPFEKRLTGFMQLPIEQDYLSGHFYAIKRSFFDETFKKYGITGIHDGVVGEDLFVDLLVPKGRLKVSHKKCFYEPATYEEYAKYFGRMRWQNEQMKNLFEKLNIDCQDCFTRKNTSALLKEKWGNSRNRPLFLSRLIPAVFRHTFLFINKNKINNYYEDLGPIVEKGNHILRDTRSESTK